MKTTTRTTQPQPQSWTERLGLALAYCFELCADLNPLVW